MKAYVVVSHRGWGESTEVEGVFASNELAREHLVDKMRLMPFSEGKSGNVWHDGQQVYASIGEHDVVGYEDAIAYWP